MKIRLSYPVAVLAIILAFLITSCFNKSTNPEEELLPLEGKILFSLSFSVAGEAAVAKGSELSLNMQTEKIYHCFNWTIASSLTGPWPVFEKPTFLASIQGVQTYSVCLTAFGPATNSFQLGLSSSDATLQFNYKNLVDTYSFSIIDSQIVVQTVNSSFTEYQP